jgi:hypothetical protein
MSLTADGGAVVIEVGAGGAAALARYLIEVRHQQQGCLVAGTAGVRRR